VRWGPWLARPLIGAILTLLVGCSAAPEPGPSLPTFPASDAASASAAAAWLPLAGVSARTIEPTTLGAVESDLEFECFVLCVDFSYFARRDNANILGRAVL